MRLSGVACIALDFGGTIATPGPVPDGDDVLGVLRSRFGYPPVPALAEAIESVRMEARAANRRTGKQTGWDVILAEGARRAAVQLPDVDALVTALWESVPDSEIDPAAAGAIRRLHRDGHVLILACNTQRPPAVRHRTLADAGLADCFVSLVLSSAVGTGKPQPEFYDAVAADALRNAGCGPEGILFVGDTPGKDVIGPLRSGMRAALVCDGDPPAGLPGDVPVIGHLRELPALLDGHHAR